MRRTSFLKDLAYSTWNESARQTLFAHENSHANETIRKAGAVLKDFFAAIEAETKKSVLDDLICLVNYSFKR